MYDDLIKCLESKGIVSFFQSPRQLVVSASFPNWPSYNSFWVTHWNEVWYISTWLPAVYRSPKGVDICQVCCDALRCSETQMYTLGLDCVSKHGLERLSEVESDLLLEELSRGIKR